MTVTITIPDWLVLIARLAIIGVVIAVLAWLVWCWPDFLWLIEFSKVMNTP